MEFENSRYNSLVIENEELRRNLALSLNKPLIKKLNEAMKRINEGSYISSEEFFKD